MNFRERVGANIKHYRGLKDITLKETAALCGITEATMQKYEAGNIKNVTCEMVEKIASALDVSPEDITGWLSEEEKQAAHIERAKAKRKNKWVKRYNDLPQDKQRAVNRFMEYVEEHNIDRECLSVLRKYERLDDHSKTVVKSVIDAESARNDEKKKSQTA